MDHRNVVPSRPARHNVETDVSVVVITANSRLTDQGSVSLTVCQFLIKSITGIKGTVFSLFTQSSTLWCFKNILNASKSRFTSSPLTEIDLVFFLSLIIC